MLWGAVVFGGGEMETGVAGAPGASGDMGCQAGLLQDNRRAGGGTHASHHAVSSGAQSCGSCDSLGPQGLQHARLPGLSPTPGACSNSRPSSR